METTKLLAAINEVRDAANEASDAITEEQGNDAVLVSARTLLKVMRVQEPYICDEHYSMARSLEQGKPTSQIKGNIERN